MSCYESEHGVFTLSTTEYPKLKAKIISAYNKCIKKDYATLVAFFEALTKSTKGKRGVNWDHELNEMLKKTEETYRYGWREKSLCYDFETIDLNDVQRLLLRKEVADSNGYLKYIPCTPRSPKKGDFKELSSSEKRIGNDDCEVIFDATKRQVIWDVPENNRAIDRANQSALGRIFSSALKEVIWTRGTGGYYTSNDEYNSGTYESGGGGNRTYGYIGSIGEKQRDYVQGPIFSRKPIKPKKMPSPY